MKKSLFLFLIASVSFAVSESSYECYSELAKGDEIVEVVFSSSNTVSISVDGEAVEFVQNASYVEDGDIEEYGQATLTITASNGEKVKLVSDYDELILDISALGLSNLNDERYMCGE